MSALRSFSRSESLVFLITLTVIGVSLLVPGSVGAWMQSPMCLILGMTAQAGWSLAWHDGGIRVGQVHVPWSEDCSGIAYFITLPAVAAYVAWSGAARVSLTRVVFLPLVLALLVNVARVAAIIAYRLAFAPEVESAQLHYLLGFIGLVPALLILLPSQARALHWLFCLHLSAALGLLSPHLAAPGGFCLLAAAILILWKRTMSAGQRPAAFYWLLWTISAIWIALSQMESLWLAWLLGCPWRSISWRREPENLIPLACTIPMIAMLWWVPFLLIAGFVLMVIRWWFHRMTLQPSPATGSLALKGLLSATFILPYLSLAYAHGTPSHHAPPQTLLPVLTAKNCYELRLTNTHPSLRIDWIAAQGGGRHHSIQVCMAYRGEYLSSTSEAVSVFTDGRVLRREFFLLDDELVEDYASYLRRTFWPGSGTGVHLIISAPDGVLAVADFESECRVLAARITQHCRPNTSVMVFPAFTMEGS